MNLDYEKEIERGAIVTRETKTRITLMKPKRFNWVVFILLFLFLPLIGALLYILYYAVKQPQIRTYTKEVKK